VGRLAAEIITGKRDPAKTSFRRLDALELRVNETLMERFGLEVPRQFRRWQSNTTGRKTNP